MVKKKPFNKALIGIPLAVTITIIFFLFAPVVVGSSFAGVFTIPFVPTPEEVAEKNNMEILQKLSELDFPVPDDEVFDYCISNPTEQNCIILNDIFERNLLELEKIIIINATSPEPPEDIAEFFGFTETFGIRANILLTDTLGSQVESTADIQLVPATLVNEQGQIFDLGFIEIEFLGITQAESAEISSSGTIDIEFAGETIDTKAIFFDGLTVDHKVILNTAISEDVPFNQRNKQLFFDFELLVQDLPNESVNTFKVILNDFNVSVNDQGSIKLFRLGNPTTVYSLDLQIDESRTVILNDNNEIVQVVKADDNLIVCTAGTSEVRTSTPEITVELDGEIILTIPPQTAKGSSKWYENEPDCIQHTGLPRDSNLIIRAGGIDYMTTTPVSQKNYSYYCNITSTTSNACKLQQTLDPNQPNFGGIGAGAFAVYCQLGFLEGSVCP